MSGPDEALNPVPGSMDPGGLFEALGGMEVIEQLTRSFYARVEGDPLLRPLFRKNLNHSRERLTLFPAERFGGPKGFSNKTCPINLQRPHAALPIRSAEAHAWLDHMEASVRELNLPECAKDLLSRYFMEEAQSLETPFCRYKTDSLPELERRLREDASILSVRDALGRTLLDAAAADWDSERVRLLLAYGARPDGEGGSPLHHAANRYVPAGERCLEAGREIVVLLAEVGAEVNAWSGVGGQTPLHMAARRGNLAVAEALLAAGADRDAPDKKGETPLRRAVNCGHGEIVALLLRQGANPHLPDQRGTTPFQAAQLSRNASLLPLFA